MKAFEIMQTLFSLCGEVLKNTQDVLKAGDPHREVKKIATTMFPTVKTIKEACEWGADLLIVHEPLYFNHYDAHCQEKIESEKRALVEQSGMTIYRFHDYSHHTIPDFICKGVLDQIRFDGVVEHCGFGLSRVKMNEATTAQELAALLKRDLRLNNVRLCGNTDFKTSNIAFSPGWSSRGDWMHNDNCIFVVGEVCEWADLEYIRDSAELGHHKAMIILGHVGSERDGMRYTAKVLKEQFPQIEVCYFETEEVYYSI